MGKRARELHDDSPISGGHFITRLARSYFLLTREITRSMVRYYTRVMSLQMLESLRVIMRVDDVILRIRSDDAVPEESAATPKLQRRGTCRPAPRGAQQGP